MTYHDRNEAEIRSLQPGLQNLVRYCMYRLGRIGEDVLIVQGFRTREEQEEAFNKGTSHVHYPYSFHNHGVALDVVPVLFGQRRLVWNAKKRYGRIASVFVQNGFEHGYALWGWDWPHMQYRDGKTIRDFIDGYNIKQDSYKEYIEDAYAADKAKLERAKRFANELRKVVINAELAYIEELESLLV